MAKFYGVEEWGLQAIVGGSTSNMIMKDTSSNQPSSLCAYDIQQDNEEFLFSFSHHLEKSNDGLEALYKPFYPVSDSSCTQRPSNGLTRNEVKNDQEVQAKDELVDTSACSNSPSSGKRKNHHKRVVIEVKAEDLSSDMWAWRKYGQKPIRGSIYPRSYYRCSSIRECLARKQVDRNGTNPGMYNVTYTAEHCHAQPTKRNSLAGTVRQKFPTPKTPVINGSQTSRSMERGKDSNSVENELMSPNDDFFSGLEDLYEAGQVQ